MTVLDNRQLLYLIRYAPVVVVFVFALSVNLIVIQNNREQAAQSIEHLREELNVQRKDTIRSEVHQVYKQLLIEKSKIESDLKDKAKQRVYEAYGIANYIYAQNINKSKSEISQLILEALSPIRFFDGRGYFLIIANDGTMILNGANSYLEGQNFWGLQDGYGLYVVQRMLDVTKNNGEGFLSWRSTKPKASDTTEFEKVGYIKSFKPYKWSIATGDYFSDFESDVKKKILRWFSDYEYGENGRFLVLDKNGTLLAHHENDFLGLDFIVGEKIPDKLLKDINGQINNGGGYIRYSKPLTLSGTVELEQVSYVKEVKGWDWIIGTGFSLRDLEKSLRLKEERFKELNHQRLMHLVLVTFVSMLLLVVSSLVVGNLIARRFKMFQRQIQDDFDKLTDVKNSMEYMALHDPLTDLPNRVLMLRDIEEKMAFAKAESKMLAIMFVDLDNFKYVNDIYGHYAGDLLLEVVGLRFKKIAGNSGSVSRFGGDEFVFCFANLEGKQEARKKAQLIQNAMVTPIVIDGKSLCLNCSIGVSLYPEDSTDAEVLIRQADTVLYKSKADKKGQVLFYSSCISAQIKRKMEIQHELAQALHREELFVHYQPQMRACDGMLVSVEALARWEHPVLGSVSPYEFISIAEEAGMIHDLDMFIFKRACEDIYLLSGNGDDALKLSVNISPVQLLEAGFSGSLLDICSSVGIDPKRITLEVTENIFIHNLNTVQPVLNELRNEGFGLSLDDFGTGYSSLSYINNLPLTEIKIDRSFISKFLDVDQTDMLVRTIISISRSCNMVVVAEGVETKAQFEKLLNYECDLLQGYYFYRPLTIEQLTEACLSENSSAGMSKAYTSDEF